MGAYAGGVMLLSVSSQHAIDPTHCVLCNRQRYTVTCWLFLSVTQAARIDMLMLTAAITLTRLQFMFHVKRACLLTEKFIGNVKFRWTGTCSEVHQAL